MSCLVILGVLVASFFFTAFMFWLVTLLLPFIGIVFAFTWLRALIIWLMIIILKMIFK